MRGPTPLGGVLVIADFALRAAVRQRIFSIVGALSFFLVIGSLVFRTFEFGDDELGFLTDFGLGVIFFFGSLLAVLLASLRWFEELSDRTLLPVLARPVSRTQFFLGQWLGVAATLAFFVFGLIAVLFVLLLWRAGEIEGFRPEAGFFSDMGWIGGHLFVAGLIQVARLLVVAGFVFMLGSFARGVLYTATLSFLFLVIGQLMPVANAFAPSLGTGPARWLFEGATALFPNLGAFSLDGGRLLAEPLPALTAIGLVGYALLYVMAYLGLGIRAFRSRDL
jgi:ABC-type transport system involved in multi-copper enzyme maturation permease subunit